MGMESPCYGGLLGRECDAFLKGFSWGGGGAMGRKCDIGKGKEKEEGQEEEHIDGWEEGLNIKVSGSWGCRIGWQAFVNIYVFGIEVDVIDHHGCGGLMCLLSTA